ncbi:orotidine-5'-phosphate decarboxylase [Azospirillum sp. RWY-5-1]|uniref:Orotidine 5'-phosphate decarboxylase n=1 Tax=Azospirillum oleiclasticum TaxID=2735135 RepID=A0ABX2TE26_9PROT|nr:orotidine-5'-phosphate decarboxylase [Azospirillum oleiclasticum]NYZ14697.1 orotidine-5'-phosphate decarboxylase [Azospirillum oleiclasticum]NYZ22317.1 orotidine-5'-phosphate decarboxylase [Azospirillum oleiclasticum]
MVSPASRIYCAIDTTDLDTARSLAARVSGFVGGLKLGLEFFVANGPAGVRAVVEEGRVPLFLDLKLHDIPNTVAGAVKAALPLKPAFITIHAAGGPAMIAAAAEAARAAGASRPRILAVTVLTSLDGPDLDAVGQSGPVADQVRRLAVMARAAGADGVVCSPVETVALRQACGPGFSLMVPGIRPSWAAPNDQKRVMTPADALRFGADHLVIGRPITEAADPADAARRIVAEIEGG